MKEVADVLGAYTRQAKPAELMAGSPIGTAATESLISRARLRFAASFADSYRRIAVATAAMLILVALIIGVVVKLRTPYGTLRVQLKDPSLELLVDGDRMTIERLVNPLRIKAGPHTVSIMRNGEELAPGQQLEIEPSNHTLILRFNGVTLESPQFQVDRNGTALLEVELQPIAPDASNPARIERAADEIDMFAHLDAVKIAWPNVSWDGTELTLRADSGSVHVPVPFAAAEAKTPEEYDLALTVVRRGRPGSCFAR